MFIKPSSVCYKTNNEVEIFKVKIVETILQNLHLQRHYTHK